jgi:hypothetical protein
MEQPITDRMRHRDPWNKGKLVGQKAPLRLKEIWAIRIRLQLAERARELALFNLAVDCKLRSCDLVRLRVRDVAHGERMATRAIVMQQKLSGRCSSKSQSRAGRRSRHGFGGRVCAVRTSYSPVAFVLRCICRRDNTPASFGAGSAKSAWTPRRMVPIRCAAPRLR